MSPWPIAELIPHAGDMILIDQVLRFGDEDIETQLSVRNGNLFSQEDGSLPAWVGIELMAQSVAFLFEALPGNGLWKKQGFAQYPPWLESV